MQASDRQWFCAQRGSRGRRIHSLLAVAIVAAVLFACPSASLAQVRAITQYPIQSWASVEGLPGNSVEALIQSPNGYLWIGTEDGFARFDGVRFTEFSKGNTPGILASQIWAFARNGENGLWIGTNGAGLMRYDGRRFVTIGTTQGLASNSVYALNNDSTGLWIGSTGGLNRIRNNKVETIRGDFEGSLVRSIVPAAGGGVWVGSEKRGLFLVRGGIASRVPGSQSLQNESIRALLEDTTGLWIATGHGLFHLRHGALTAGVGTPARFATTEIRALLRDRDGGLWIGTAGEGLARFLGGKIESITSRDHLPSDIITALIQDTEGSIWVGLQGGGVAVLRQGVFVGTTPREGLSGEVTLPIMQDYAGSLWIGTFGHGLNRLNRGAITSFGVRDGLQSDFITSLAEGSDSTLWIGTRSGLDRRKKGVIRRYAVGGRAFAGPVMSIVTDSADVWVGTMGGLWKIRGDSTELFTTSNGLSNNFVYALHRARNGDLWIGTNGGGATRLRKGRFDVFRMAQGLSSDAVFTFHEEQDGTLWIATTGGLNRLKGGKVASVGVKNGLFDEKVYRVLDDGAGNFWMSSNRGIFRVSRAELNAVADGKARTLISTVFTEADGLPSREANGGIQPAGWKDKSGRLWFPTMKGAASVDPSLIQNVPSAFPVRVERVVVNDNEIPTTDSISLGPDTRSIQFDYTALSFLAPASIAFEYRLTGYDDAWIEAGQRRSAFYTNIPPGHYTFRVRARRQSGRWSSSQSVMAVSIHPYFHQTAAFKVGALLALLGLLVAVDRWRLSRHRVRERELLGIAQERERAEKRYRDLFEGANDIVFTADLAGRLSSANLQARKVLRIEGSLPGTVALEDVVAPESLAAFQLTASGNEPGAALRQVCEVNLLARDGSRIEAEASIQQVHENGETLGIQAIVRDITDRRRLEAKLRQSHRMEAVGQLAGGIAHDFNNLLSVIKSTAYVLGEGMPASDQTRADLNEIDKATDRGAALTQQLLAFTRQQVLSREVVNPNDLVREVVSMIKRMVPENIEIRQELDPSLFNVEVDPGQIHQVLLNLSLNARDAMTGGGILSMRTFNAVIRDHEQQSFAHPMKAGSYACLNVSDTGTGMDAEAQKRAFEPFFTTKPAGEGSGLGLATAYGIVKQSGGYIWLTSEGGKGTAFDVYLPMSDSPIPSRGGSADTPESVRSHETILIVEDDPPIRRLIERIVRIDGYTTLVAGNGQEALQELENAGGKVDLVITDIVMPVMGGREMAERILVRYPHIKILFTSGYAEDEAISTGLSNPSLGFIQKPARPQAIRMKIRDLLNK